MGYLINPTRELIEATFPIVAGLNNIMNVALIVVGVVAGAIWIGLMLKYEGQEVSNR